MPVFMGLSLPLSHVLSSLSLLLSFLHSYSFFFLALFLFLSQPSFIPSSFPSASFSLLALGNWNRVGCDSSLLKPFQVPSTLAAAAVGCVVMETTVQLQWPYLQSPKQCAGFLPFSEHFCHLMRLVASNGCCILTQQSLFSSLLLPLLCFLPPSTFFIY